VLEKISSSVVPHGSRLVEMKESAMTLEEIFLKWCQETD